MEDFIYNISIFLIKIGLFVLIYIYILKYEFMNNSYKLYTIHNSYFNKILFFFLILLWFQKKYIRIILYRLVGDSMFKSDLQIAQESKLTPITEIVKKIGLEEKDIELYGKYKAKLNLDVYNNNQNDDGKLILVTSINPTKAGEGKSTTTIGLADGLKQLNKNVMVTLREPSLGPVFGLKGGATGGGYAQVVPMEDINLHFTGDMHAITSANNLISACLDNHLYQGNTLQIDPNNIVWKRCLDMNDRALRNITVGQDDVEKGISHHEQFIITVASEVMAVLCLSVSYDDLKQRIARMLVAYTKQGNPVFVDDLGITGAVSMLLKDALKPNLVQTLEHTPAIVHGGPFANIAHGCNSLLATKTALKLSDYVVTEAGFGADLGAEKFLDIKCRIGELKPSCVVIVATVRALKLHGGVSYENIGEENIDALLKGCLNLKKHIETIQSFGLPYIVTANVFSSDTENELKTLQEWCYEHNHPFALSNVWLAGGKGALDLAKLVISLCEQHSNYRPLYTLDKSIEEKIKTVATTVYGAKEVHFSEKALQQIKQYNKFNWNQLPICIAKTPMSLSDNPKLIGVPNDITITVREIQPNLGAGFLVIYTGHILTMPGLPKKPAAMDMELENDGSIKGLF